MTERPIIFSENIPRILDGTKTQTRRVIKHPEYYGCLTGDCPHDLQAECDAALAQACPYGAPGDRLWVRERWASDPCYAHLPPSQIPHAGTIYYETGEHLLVRNWHKVRSPMFMPRWASRIDLKILNVLPERLQSIREEDARAEGVRLVRDGGGTFAGREGPNALITPWLTAREAFMDLWDSINAKRGYPWAGNPWVWRIEYGRENL